MILITNKDIMPWDILAYCRTRNNALYTRQLVLLKFVHLGSREEKYYDFSMPITYK